ncbi:hypothetical protein BGX29_006166, partial [Mortierella sp. GBA35]
MENAGSESDHEVWVAACFKRLELLTLVKKGYGQTKTPNATRGGEVAGGSTKYRSRSLFERRYIPHIVWNINNASSATPEKLYTMIVTPSRRPEPSNQNPKPLAAIYSVVVASAKEQRIERRCNAEPTQPRRSEFHQLKTAYHRAFPMITLTTGTFSGCLKIYTEMDPPQIKSIQATLSFAVHALYCVR